MIKIKQDHWCQNCRVMQTEWTVLGTTGNNRLLPADPWPINEPVRSVAHDKCDACNEEVSGQVIFRIDEHATPSHFISGVRQEL